MARLALMLDEEARLVTLIGPGGIGKTRIAIEVASRLEPNFAHGVAFVELAPVHDPAHVVPYIAQALGARESADLPPDEELIAMLRDRHLLLVIDNAEHMLDTVALWLDNVVSACPRVTVLVTSRIALKLSNEQRFRVPSLPVPASISNSAMLLSGNAAINLFVRRVQAVEHDFALTEDNVDTVRRICERLEGIPLAIELAAARVAVLTPSQILARLGGRFDLLSGNSRDAPARHQTMRAVIEWSYSLLSEPERMLFRRISIFAGGFTVDAAETVVDQPTLLEADLIVVDVLAELADHSLVHRMPAAKGEPRLAMLETVRQFGLEQLEAHGDVPETRNRHAGYLLRLAEAAKIGFEGPDQLSWLRRFDSEQDNVRLAESWLIESNRIDEAVELACNTQHFRFMRGFFTESLDLHETLAEHAGDARCCLARAKSLVRVSGLSSTLGNHARAIRAIEEAMPIARSAGDDDLLNFALTVAGMVRFGVGDLKGAVILGQERLALAERSGNSRMQGGALNDIGLVLGELGQLDDATPMLEQAVQIARDSGDLWAMALSMSNLGLFLISCGHYDRAEPHSRESIRVFELLEDYRDLPHALVMLGAIARTRSDFAAAREHLTRALRISLDTGNQEATVTTLMELATMAGVEGQVGEAVRYLHEGIGYLASAYDQVGMAQCLDCAAGIAFRAGDNRAAVRFAIAADARYARLNKPRVPGLSQHEHDARIEAARDELGDSGFASVSDVGRSLTDEKVRSELFAFNPPGGATIAPSPTKQDDATELLSNRELEVLKLMADGLTNQEIADMLFVSPRTAASHASNILGKLGIPTRTAAVAFAIRNGLA